MGIDEYGEKISKVVVKGGVILQELVDDFLEWVFQGLWKKFGISYDFFICIILVKYKKYVQDVFQWVYDVGDIYFVEYEGFYLVGVECYVIEKELVEGFDGVWCFFGDKDLFELWCEVNYFFNMQKYQFWLLEILQ